MAAITHKPTGWNTWDFRGFNRLEFLRQGRVEIELLYAIWDEHVPPPSPDSKQLGRLHDTFRWTDVRTLGEHGDLGLPATLDFAVGETLYRAQATDTGGTLRVTVTPLTPSRHRVVFMFVLPAGESPDVASPTTGQFAKWQVELEGATWPSDYFLNIPDPYAVGQEGQPATITLRPPKPVAVRDGTSEAFRERAVCGSGALADAPEAMMKAVAWNTLYDTRRNLVSSPVSRDWCYDWRGVLVFCWDTYLVGAMCSYQSRELARTNFETVTAAVDVIGHVPNYFMAHGAVSLDRSMPPLGAYMIWKVEQAARDREWLRRIYPRLRKWHTYWMRNRDGNGDGLLEWGTNAAPQYQFPQLLPYNPSLQHTEKCAMYESGLDNSPMFDGVPFNAEANTLELADVALNSYYAMDCEALAAIADALGRPREAAAYRKEHDLMKWRMNQLLWDESNGIYANRHWDGRHSRRWSPTSFFPLIAGIPDERQAQRLIREHLLNENEFWGQYVIPAIARNDPAFPDNDYWRGRIWGPFNFLVAEGLRRYRFDDVAADLAQRGLAMFMDNWRKDGGIYENYNATTGVGGDVWNAARLYHWGGLMAFIGMQELIDVEPAGWLRFGSVTFPDATVQKVQIGGDSYDVELGRGVKVRLNGADALECTVRAIIRIPTAGSGPIQISAREPGQLIVRPALGLSPDRPVQVNGQAPVKAQVSQDGLAYSWSIAAPPA